MIIKYVVKIPTRNKYAKSHYKWDIQQLFDFTDPSSVNMKIIVNPYLIYENDAEGVR